MLISLWLAVGGVLAGAGEPWPDLATPPAAQAIGGGENDSALIVAIEDYVAVPRVPGARRNADDWYRYFTSTLRMPAERITVLRDGEGTLEKMRRFATATAQAQPPQGRIWFVFIGHGAPALEGTDGMLVGFDAQQDADSLVARSLRQGELLELLGSNGPRRTIAILDTCFSGRTPEGNPLLPGLQPLVAVAPNRAPPPEVAVLTAGASDQFAGPLEGGKRPAFSYLMLGALRGWADRDLDAQITIEEALAFARQALQTTVKGRIQTPQRWGGDGGWVLATNATEKGPALADVVLEIARRPLVRSVSAEPSGFTLVHAGWASAGVTAAGGILFGIAWLHLQSLGGAPSEQELYATASRGQTLEAVGVSLAAAGSVGLAVVGVLALIPKQAVPIVVSPTSGGVVVGAGFSW